MAELGDALARLEATIAARKGADPASSYTAKLAAREGRSGLDEKASRPA